MARDLCGFWKSLRAGSVLCSTLDPNDNYTTVMRYVHIIYTKVQRAKRRVCPPIIQARYGRTRAY